MIGKLKTPHVKCLVLLVLYNCCRAIVLGYFLYNFKLPPQFLLQIKGSE